MHDPGRAYSRKYGCANSETEDWNEDTDLPVEPELEKQCKDDESKEYKYAASVKSNR